jgi:hypothetical protein
MANLSSYKPASVPEQIEAANATLRFLPSYSPNFYLRKAEEQTLSAF